MRRGPGTRAGIEGRPAFFLPLEMDHSPCRRYPAGIFFAALVLLSLVAACSDQPASPPVPPATAVAQAASPTPSPLPATASPSPAATATRTPLPLPTATLGATASPTATATPSTTPTPSATPLPRQISQEGAEMVLVARGFFEMGGEAQALLDECRQFRPGCRLSWFTPSEPRHLVFTNAFYIDRFEVNNGAFLRFLQDLSARPSCAGAPCFRPEDSRIEQDAQGRASLPSPSLEKLPVTGVTWPGAAAFCRWRGARLPTEAEWEKAARWHPEESTTTAYPWGDAFDPRGANSCDASCSLPQANAEYDDGFSREAPPGSFPAGRSGSGAFDMAGNVWEWVADWFDPDYYALRQIANPSGPGEGKERVVRGGSWFDTGNFTSSLIRFPAPPDESDVTIGFRCARDVPGG